MMLRWIALCFAVLAIPAGAAGTEAGSEMIRLPSGAELRWLETLQDNAGGMGLTYRFRFLMPDLAQRVPSTSGPASEPGFDTPPGAGYEPVEIDTESGDVEIEAVNENDYPADGLIDPATLEPAPAEADDAAEAAADAMIEEPVLPAAPDVLAEDPLHDDIVWLCQNWVLPRIASPGPRPVTIMISIADKDIPFATYDPEVLQLFEAFRLPPDRDECQWEIW